MDGEYNMLMQTIIKILDNHAKYIKMIAKQKSKLS